MTDHFPKYRFQSACPHRKVRSLCNLGPIERRTVSVTTSRWPTHHPVDIWSGGRSPDGGALREACSLDSRRSCWRIQCNDWTLHQSIPAQTATTLVELDQARFALRFVAELEYLSGQITGIVECQQQSNPKIILEYRLEWLALPQAHSALLRASLTAVCSPCCGKHIWEQTCNIASVVDATMMRARKC